MITDWLKPAAGRMKLNTDGCGKGNPGLGGGGCLLRSSTGNLLWARANFFGQSTNMTTEALALLNGLKLCLDKGYAKVEVESDYLVLVRTINGRLQPPWSISYELKQIRDLMKHTECSVKHTFRESNIGADVLANLGFKEKKELFFDRWDAIPRVLRGIVKLDKCGCVTFVVGTLNFIF